MSIGLERVYSRNRLPGSQNQPKDLLLLHVNFGHRHLYLDENGEEKDKTSNYQKTKDCFEQH